MKEDECDSVTHPHQAEPEGLGQPTGATLEVLLQGVWMSVCPASHGDTGSENHDTQKPDESPKHKDKKEVSSGERLQLSFIPQLPRQCTLASVRMTVAHRYLWRLLKGWPEVLGGAAAAVSLVFGLCGCSHCPNP